MVRKPRVKKFVCKICGTTTYSDTNVTECDACGANDFTKLCENDTPKITVLNKQNTNFGYIIGNFLGFAIAGCTFLGIVYGVLQVIRYCLN